ncbi:GNAT family N-acetyltransferase [Flavobacterium rhizosphaerae]|uniref:GNAT family N-acetyltransferase n=1 Tax=Flavobacterium rhizosphaerae TaxID=3163298 RepID=A0ABW8YZM4_9FLAO
MYAIKIITAAQTHPIRQEVLRPGQPVERCVFAGDEAADTIHFGLFTNNELAGIISLFKTPNPLFTEKEQYQVRGMAILRGHQKKGFGDALLKKAEAHATANGATRIWCNARENALGFYQKVGYLINGAPFLIEGVGIHSVMHKAVI